MDSNSSSSSSTSSSSSSFSSSSSSSTNNNNNIIVNNGLPHQNQKPIMERSDSKNRRSTIYVKADTSSFKQIVQKLTGSTETTDDGSFKATASSSRNNIPPIQPMPEKQQSKLNLHERRNSHSSLPLFPSNPSSFAHSPRDLDINLSPSRNFYYTALSLGPATPHISDQYGYGIHPNLNIEAKVNGIQEKEIFLHPLPANTSTPKDAEPRLLPLFPTSPQDSDGPSST